MKIVLFLSKEMHQKILIGLVIKTRNSNEAQIAIIVRKIGLN